MTRESPILREVEYCLGHFGFFVIPRDTRASKEANYSIWKLVNPRTDVGVIWRCNTGAARYGKAFVRFGIPGLPDFQGWIFNGRRVSIEVKADNGKLTPDQFWHMELASQTGNLAGCVRSYAECEALLTQWGLKRK